MQQNQQSQIPASELTPRESETVSELVHRHLRDANHVTTDEELRNAKLDFHEDKAEKLLVVDQEIEQESDDKDKLPGEKDIVFTPWNITG